MSVLRRAHAVSSILLLALAACQLPRQKSTDRLVVGEIMTNSQLARNLRALCLPGGRLSGSPNGQIAQQFVADHARQYGLKNVHLEPYNQPGWQSKHTAVTELTDPPLALQEAQALWNSLSTPPDGLTAELLDLAEATPEDFDRLGDALSGKLGLVREGNGTRTDKMRLALEHHAAGLVYYSPTDRQPVIGSCHPLPRPEPGVVIRHADGQNLADLLAAGQTVRLNIKIEADVWDAHPANVVAEIPGTGPLAHEIVIMCAHLDSWHLAEGALDNANGSATILEAARALAALSWHPRRTVRFIWFMGEEQNLLGSRAYVAAHSAELPHVVAVVNVDMPGSPRKLSTSGPPQMAAFLRSFCEQWRGYELDPEIGKLAGNFSDHAPFLDAGVTTISLSGDLGPGVSNYHTPNDTYDMVDRRASTQSAAVLAALVCQLADRPAP